MPFFAQQREAPEMKARSSSDRILGFTKQNIVISPGLILYKEGEDQSHLCFIITVYAAFL